MHQLQRPWVRYPSICRHSGIWGVADEKKIPENPRFLPLPSYYGQLSGEERYWFESSFRFIGKENWFWYLCSTHTFHINFYWIVFTSSIMFLIKHRVGSVEYTVKKLATIRYSVPFRTSWSLGSFADPDPHPDPLVTSTDPAPDPSIIKQKNLDFYFFVTSLWLFTSVPDSHLDPDPHELYVLGLRIRIRIRTEMSRIRSAARRYQRHQ
jgi:hypothetical protein